MFKYLIKPAFLLGVCTTLAACSGDGHESSSGSVLNTPADSVHLSKPILSSTQAQLKAHQSNYGDQKSIKIENISSHAIDNLSTHLTSHIKGVTTSGCVGELGSEQTCTLTFKAHPNAEGKGQVIVSGNGTANLSLPVSVDYSSLEIGNSMIQSPWSKTDPYRSAILVANDSEVPSKIDASNIKVVDGSGDSSNISINRHGGCFSSYYKHGNVITLSDGQACDLQIQAKQGAKSHALVKLTGNFARPQYGLISIAAPTFAVSGETNSNSINLKLNRHSHSFSSGFDINKLDIKLDNQTKHIANFGDSDSKKVSFGGLDLGPKMITFSADNIADNISPLLDYIIGDSTNSYLTINNALRQNLPQDEQTPAFVGLALSALNIKQVTSIKLSDNIQAVTPGPVGPDNKRAGQSIQACKQALNASGDTEHTCTLWIKPNNDKVKLGEKKQHASLTVNYINQQGLSSTQTVSFAVNRHLVATGSVNLPDNKANDNNTRVDSNSAMSWNGSTWHWNEGGKRVFDNIDIAAVNTRGQLCVNGDGSFACFNGYQWLKNNRGLPSAYSNYFGALTRLPNNQQAFGNKLAGSLIALTSQDKHHLYYLPAYATNSSFNDNQQSSWHQFSFEATDNQKLAIGNVVTGSSKLFLSDADSHKAVIYQGKVSLSHQEGSSDNKHTLDKIGNPISINRTLIRQYLLLANGDNKIFVGGQQNGKPVVYKNQKNADNKWQNWQSIGGPNIKGYIASLKNGSNGPVMTVLTHNRTQSIVYQYNAHDSGQWQKVGSKANPAVTVYYDHHNQRYYIGTLQYGVHNHQDSFVLSTGGQKDDTWQSVGNIKTYNGSALALTPVDHINITGYTES